MHLQINLSSQLIKQWNPQLTDPLPETHPLLRWRIDKIKLDRTTANYICVNEATLFSFLLPSLPGKKALEVQQLFIDRLRMFLQEYFFPEPARSLFDRCPVFYGKSNSRELVGSINNMRQLHEIFFLEGRTLQEAEQLINRTPFSGCFPLDEFLKQRDLFEDPEGRMISFRMPGPLVFSARRAFMKDDPPALRCFDSRSWTDGMCTARLTLDDLIVFRERVVELLEEQQYSREISDLLVPVAEYLCVALAPHE